MFLNTLHCFLLILSSQCLQELSAQTYAGTLFDPNQERSELLDFDDGSYGNWSHTGVKIVGIGDNAEIPDKEDGSGDGDDRKGSAKGKCKNSGPKPKDRIFAKYTKPYPANSE